MGKLQRASAAALLLSISLLLLLSSTPPTADARPVVGLHAVDLSSVAMPDAGVALPKEALGRPDELAHAHHQNGCDDMALPTRMLERPPVGVDAAMRGEKLGDLYGPLLLNLLPRGLTPPSAPSTGTDDDRT